MSSTNKNMKLECELEPPVLIITCSGVEITMRFTEQYFNFTVRQVKTLLAGQEELQNIIAAGQNTRLYAILPGNMGDEEDVKEELHDDEYIYKYSQILYKCKRLMLILG